MTFYAVTSTTGKPEFFGIGETRSEAWKEFKERVPFNIANIYSVTRHRNVEVISKTAAIKRKLISRKGFLLPPTCLQEEPYRVEIS